MDSHNKNIAIITYSEAVNYGSALQTYALNRWLRELGHNVKTIKYSNCGQQQMYRLFEANKSIHAIARNIHTLLKLRQTIRHKKAFDSFAREYIPMTSQIYDASQFERLNNEFDYFICGSDQIWNVQCDDYDSRYMLDFVKDKSRCIAYAPSLGSGIHNALTTEQIHLHAKCFKALSSRERESSIQIASTLERDCETVVDPVFLLDASQWSKIAPKSKFKGDYILGYFIGDVEGMRDYAAALSQKNKLPVVVIYKNLRDLKYPFKTFYQAGPADFVSLIKHSKYIVTNSFHAVAFSLIFKKDFSVFTPKGSSDTRISNILSIVGLSNRIINNQPNCSTTTDDIIDYSKVNLHSLNFEISKSKQFLINNLD